MNRKRSWIRYGPVVALSLAVVACTAIPQPEAPPPAPAPAPTPAPAPIAPPAKPWDERALDNGVWRYDAGSRTARFAPAASASPLVAMSCSGDGIRITADMGSNNGQPVDVALRTTAGTDQLRFSGNSSAVPSRDPRLDRIAFSRGRFALEAPNGRTLTLPVQSEIGRVIEDCR